MSRRSAADRDWLTTVVAFLAFGMGLMCVRAIVADAERSRLDNDTAHTWLDAAKVMRGR